MPQFPTMQIPPRLPLVVATSNRDGSTKKDARLVNCYIETDPESNELWVIKRPGILSQSIVSDSQVGQGCFFWEGAVYSIFNGELFRNGISVGTGLDVDGGKYEFSSILGATHKLVFNNGNKGYAYDTIGGVSADLHTLNESYPETTVKGWAYLNGAEYVMDPEAVIWGSDINDVTSPGAWDPLDFISAQINPDPGVAMNQQLVYVVAFNSWSTEIFYDAGNPSGSPLGSVEGSKQSYGCASADSIQRIDDVLFWLSTNEAAQIQVAMLEKLNLGIISTKPIDRLLGSADLSAGNVLSWQLKLDGHSWYIITVISLNLTLAWDIVERRWHQWTDENGNYFPIVASTYDVDGNHVLQHATDGRLYYVSNDYFHDKTSDPIVVDIITPSFDAVTRRRKTLNILGIVGDQQTGANLILRHSDDDYQTWSKPRTVDLGQKNPRLTNCGSFTKRAYWLQHVSDTPMRLAAMEVQYDIGTL